MQVLNLHKYNPNSGLDFFPMVCVRDPISTRKRKHLFKISLQVYEMLLLAECDYFVELT